MHGLAVLAALGVTFTIKQFERTTIDTERVEAALREREEHFRALVQHASDIIMVIGPDANIRYVSPAFEAILGYSSVEAVGMAGLELAHPDDVELLRAKIIGGSSVPRAGAAEARLCQRNGTWRWFDVIITDLTDNPSVGGWVANLRDITERKAQEAALSEAQEVFRHAFDDAPIGIGLVGLDGCIQRANRSMAVLLGRTQEELAGTSIREFTHPDDLVESEDQAQRLNRSEIDFYRLEKRYVRPDGSTVWASLSVSLVRDIEGRPMYQIGQLEDITDRKLLADKLAHDAAHDSMTGLLNRASFTEHVATALSESGDRAVAVLFIDLDHFKVVNDSLGHALGDVLVTTVAQRLRSTLRPDNVIARFGGDEFVVLCPNLAGEEAAARDRPPPARCGRGARRDDDGGDLRLGEHRHRGRRPRATRRRRCSATPTPRCTAPRTTAAPASCCSSTMTTAPAIAALRTGIRSPPRARARRARRALPADRHAAYAGAWSASRRCCAGTIPNAV